MLGELAGFATTLTRERSQRGFCGAASGLRASEWPPILVAENPLSPELQAAQVSPKPSMDQVLYCDLDGTGNMETASIMGRAGN